MKKIINPCRCTGAYMCTTHALELEGPDHIGGEFLDISQGHTHHAIGLCSPGGPVLKSNSISELITGIFNKVVKK